MSNVNEATTVMIAEGATRVIGFTGDDPDIDDNVTVSIVPGGDGNLFQLQPTNPVTGTDPVMGTLEFIDPPVFGADNDYVVTVQIDDGEASPSMQTINVSVVQFGFTGTPVATPPENQTFAIRLPFELGLATAPVLQSGMDSDLFDIALDPAAPTEAAIVTFKTAPDFEFPQDSDPDGVYTFVATLDATGAPVTAMQTVTVQNVDETPVFTIETTSLEDAGPVTVTGFVTGIDTFEPGQTPTFSNPLTQVGESTGTLTLTQTPMIDASGTLTYETAADTNGSATFNVTLTDDGSNVAPNSNTSDPVSITINITAVNDAPTFTLAGNQSVNEDPDPATVTVPNFFTNPLPGPEDEQAGGNNAQTLTLPPGVAVISTDNDDLFLVAPRIDAQGTLTYTLATNESGSATVRVTLTDSGDTANEGENSSNQDFTITVAAVNDAPVVTTNTGLSVREEDTTGITMGHLGSRRGLEPSGVSVNSHAASNNEPFITADQSSNSEPKSSNRVWLPRFNKSQAHLTRFCP